MPSRILREGILTSPRVEQLGVHAEIFYRRLMSVVDDFGTFPAHPAILRAFCYPLRVDVVREADISRWLEEVQTVGLIALYAVNGKWYLEMIDFRQQIRATIRKYPAPPEREVNDKQLISNCESNENKVQHGPHMRNSSPHSDSSSSEGGMQGGKRFSVPATADVAAYCVERKNTIDPQAFIDYYTSNGWKVGRNPMKDWKSAVRTWEKNARSGTSNQPVRKVPQFRLPTPDDPRDRT